LTERHRLSDEFLERYEYLLQSITQDRKIGERDEKAFDFIHAEVESLCYRLKDVDLVSKTILKKIYSLINAAESEAPHCKGSEKRLVEMAQRLRFLFGLILIGETPDERKPGVPRII
jgi:hypothetical protein